MGFLGDIMKSVNYLATKGKQGLTSLGNFATSGLRNMHNQHEAGLRAIKDRPNLLKPISDLAAAGADTYRTTMKDLNKNTMMALGRTEKEAKQGGQFAADQGESQWLGSLPGAIAKGSTTGLNILEGRRKPDLNAAIELINAIPGPGRVVGAALREAKLAAKYATNSQVVGAAQRLAKKTFGDAPNPLTPALRAVNNRVVKPVLEGAKKVTDPIKRVVDRVDHDLKFKHPNIRKAGVYASETGHAGNARRGIINTRREEEKKKAVDQRRGRHRVENPDSFPTRTGASMDRTDQSIVHAA